MSNCPNIDWPEPIVRVQTLSQLPIIPERYVKPPDQRPALPSPPDEPVPHDDDDRYAGSIPIIDFANLVSGGGDEKVLSEIYEACAEWGFFQVINHGVSAELLERAREVWYGFFHQPMEVKQAYANSPKTYEGYGSRLGVQKGATLDWGDYYYLHFLPRCLNDKNKWPALPEDLRDVNDEYSEQVVKFCGTLMKILSTNLGLEENCFQSAFGGENIGACMRVNFYPRCPQPDLTLGLSAHSDPGGLTVLLPDQNVAGLQVRRGDRWITVKPAPHAFIVNIGDQMQVLSNAAYKSVEHRVVVNSDKERLSLAFFYNPKSDLLIGPAKELVTSEKPALYPTMSFDDYRLFIRTNGPKGKSQLTQSQKITPSSS